MLSVVALIAIIPMGATAVQFSRCDSTSETPTIRQADDLLNNLYSFAPHRTVTLPHDPSWKENPLHDRNWLLKYHSLYWTEPLWYAWVTTGQRPYYDRYVFLLKDWHYNNPPAHPQSSMSWGDHPTAIRGMVYACALSRIVSHPKWLMDSADDHGRMLADGNFYLHYGNRALDQAIGLLDIGCATHRGYWWGLARWRIAGLARGLVDSEGVSGEQSDGYNIYIYKRLAVAVAQIEKCGIEVPSDLRDRLARMAVFIANAALPDGRTVGIGDTQDIPIPSIAGTAAEYVASGGTSGTEPSELWAAYHQGYAFFHSGWGRDRPLAQETHVSVRFGAPRKGHGHLDAMSVTMAGYGDRLLLDSGGPYRYEYSNPFRKWFVSEWAHNTVAVDGRPMSSKGWTLVRAQLHTADMDFISMRNFKIPGVRHDRRVLFDRRLNAVIVEDHVHSGTRATFRQLWHLHPAAEPALTGAWLFQTHRGDGPNIRVQQLISHKQTRAYGDRSPIQGWISTTYGQLTKAPVVEAVAQGWSERFITVIVPSPAGATRAVNVSNFKLHWEGFALTLTVDGKTDRVSTGDIAGWTDPLV